jgi:Flp pilus assembly pilin Flp
MRRFVSAFWKDENGFVVSSELVLISTICVIALVVGMSQVSHAVNQELRDVAAAYSNMNQSYQAGNNGQYDDGMNHTPGEIWAAGTESESGG